MNIEESIRDVIQSKLDEGMIERLVAENLEKGINKSLENLMGSYGDITKVIEKKIKEVMIDQLSGFDYSKYIVKLDCVLAEILKNTTLDNRKILENFKDLMVNEEIPKVVKLSDVFVKFNEYVAKNVETSGLEIDYDDPVSYESVETTMEVEYENERSWSPFEGAKVVFECAKDDSLNVEIHLSKFKEYPWSLSLNLDTSISSLRWLDEFEIYLLKLQQANPNIEIDSDDLSEYVTPDAEPEATYS